MLKRLMLLCALTGTMYGQAVRFEANVTQPASNVPAGAAAPVYTVPNAIVNVCGFPAVGTPCTNTLPVYSDQALTQEIPQPFNADGLGRWGVWVPSGTYSYSLQTQSGKNVGSFIITLIASSGDATWAQTGDDISALCSAFGSNPGTIFVSVPLTVASSATLPVNCSLNILAGGKITVSSGTLTINGPLTAPIGIQVFSGNIAGLHFDRPEWLGSTLLTAVNSLSASGGTVELGWQTYQAGSFGSGISRSNVAVRGAQVPQANQPIGGSPATAFISGTGSIVQGGVDLIGSNLTFSDFGVDVGNTFNHCDQNGLAASPNDINAPMLYNIHVRNITTIACTQAFDPSAQQHSLLFEHITGLTEENITTFNGFYGNVVKAIDANITNLTSSNTDAFCGIVKSDDVFGVSRNVTINGLVMDGCRAAFAIDTFGGTVSNVVINGFQAKNMSNGAFFGHIVADVSPGFITGVKISDGFIDTSGFDAVLFQLGSTDVDVSHVTASNVTGNGIVFQTQGVSNNRAHAVFLKTVSGYGVYSFGQTDSAVGVNCSGVATACLASSGSSPTPGLFRFSDVITDGTLKFSFPFSSFLYGDQLPWQSPTYANGWHNFGAPNSTGQFRLDRDRVYLKGLIVPGSATTVAILPGGYRPTATQHFSADGYTGSAYVMCEAAIDTSGVLTVTNYAACATSYVSLDGISFPIQ